jgi:hypothetical protein
MTQSAPEFSGRDTVVDTACTLDCPDSRGLAVTVRNGRVLKIGGSRLNAPTAGYICAQVRRRARVRGGGACYNDARIEIARIERRVLSSRT